MGEYPVDNIQAKNIEIVDIESIVENPKNANKHSPKQIKRLEKLIKYQGFRNPLVISNRTGFLIAGHGRLEAAKNLGIEKLPVIKQDFENEAQEYSYLISDNEIARWAELDKELVLESIDEIELEDIDLLGIENFNKIYDNSKKENIVDLSENDVLIFAIEVRLTNEMEQQDLYDDLVSKGYTCKVMNI